MEYICISYMFRSPKVLLLLQYGAPKI